MLLPDRIYVERDPETNEKRWYSTKGMGVEYVRADDTRDGLVGALMDIWKSCHREAGFALAESDNHELATALNRLYAHGDTGK